MGLSGIDIAPVRVLRDNDPVVLELASGDGRIALVWPRGFLARLLDGRGEIVPPDGSVVGREGDVLSDILAGDPSDICEVNSVSIRLPRSVLSLDSRQTKVRPWAETLRMSGLDSSE